MKLTCVLIILCVLHASAGTFGQKVSLSYSNAPITDVLKSVKKQTGYTFLADSYLLKTADKVTIKVTEVPLTEALDICFKDQPFTYSISGKIITVKASESSSAGVTPRLILETPPITVRGRIVNENGEPVIASVTIKGTTKGTTSNTNGEFELNNINSDAVLIISATNIETILINVNNQSNLSVTVKNASSSLNEVIFNKGYYTESKVTSTGNVSKVDFKTIEKQPIANPLQAIQGRMAGVYVTQNSGIPGGSFKIRIRGQNSLRNSPNDDGNLPLYVVDGVPFTSTSVSAISGLSGGITGGGLGTDPLNTINPSDIASIEILKDADATAIYGSRGANGVVLITTKKGKIGKTTADFNVYRGVSTVSRFMDLLNTQQYLEMREEAFANANMTPGASDNDLNGTWDKNRYTDWQEVLFGGTAQTTNISAYLSGGNANTQFVAGAGYYSQGSVFPGDFQYQRGSGHFRLNHLSDNRKFALNLSATYSADKNNLPSTDPVLVALTLSPNAPAIYDPSGNLNWAYNTAGTATWTNPLAQFGRVYALKNKNLIVSADLSYELMKGLTLRTMIGYTNLQLNESDLSPQKINNPAVTSNRRSASFGSSMKNTWSLEPQIQYLREMKNSKLTILVGTSLQQTIWDGLGLQASNFISDQQMQNVSFAPNVNVRQTLIYSDYKYIAGFGRVNYAYKDRYIINVTGRRDGSSRFGPGKQFGNFGAIGTAWIFSRENWFHDNRIFSYGKLRGSYGSAGSDNIGDYKYFSTFLSSSFTYNGNTGLYSSQLINTDYSWEVNKKLEISLELGFMQNRIMTGFSWFRNRSTNQLVGYSLPNITGQNSVTYNLPAIVQNSGLEVEITSENIKRSNFTWTTNLNASFPRNKLVAYPNLAGSTYANTYAIGKSLGIRKVLNYTGVDPQTGLYTVEDLDKNGDISSPDDAAFTKEIMVNFFTGLQNSISFRGFSMDFLFQYVNQTNTNYLPLIFRTPGQMANQPEVVMNRWRKSGDITNIQQFSITSEARAAYGNIRDYGSSTVTDASFIRLRNVSLSYNLQAGVLRCINLKNVRVYVQGQNLVTITNFIGMDPESGAAVLPPLRTLTAGLQITL